MIDSPLLSTLIALAGIFLGLSLLVQVFQEVYKYLSSSKSRSYVSALVDFFGPYAHQLLRPGTLPELQARGPFQWLRRRPTGRLQPMDQEDLVAALERTAAPWIRRGVEAVRLELALQSGGSTKPSPAFRDFLRQLAGVEPGSPGYATALELRDLLAQWELSPEKSSAVGPLDANSLLLALQHRFLPAVVQAETHFAQLSKNVEYAYRRRNLRQTFLFGLGLAAIFQLPFGRLYQQASRVSLEDAVTAAQTLQAIYADQAARDSTAVEGLAQLRSLADSIRAQLTTLEVPLGSSLSVAAVRERFATPRSGALYLLGCLVTALLISFGAPFWNDLSGALLRLNRGRASPPVPVDASASASR